MEITFGTPRVNGNLAVSRTIGDFEYKKEGSELVVAEPEVFEYQYMKDLKYIMLACDGLWDVLSSSEADMAVMAAIESVTQPSQSCVKPTNEKQRIIV